MSFLESHANEFAGILVLDNDIFGRLLGVNVVNIGGVFLALVLYRDMSNI